MRHLVADVLGRFFMARSDVKLRDYTLLLEKKETDEEN